MMDWRQLGNKPLPKPMMVSLMMHICIIGLNELIFDFQGVRDIVLLMTYRGNIVDAHVLVLMS